MRFREFQDPQTAQMQSAIAGVLNSIRGDADDAEQTAEISFGALEQIMKNTGYPQFNFDLFKKVYDSSPVLKGVVADFNQERIVLNTEKTMSKDPAMNYDNVGSTDIVKKMAQSALKKRI